MKARGRYWLLLNPDVRVPADGLEKLVAWMDGHPEHGVASPDLVGADGRWQAPGRAFPSIGLTLLELTRAHRALPRDLRGRLLRGPYWIDGDQLARRLGARDLDDRPTGRGQAGRPAPRGPVPVPRGSRVVRAPVGVEVGGSASVRRPRSCTTPARAPVSASARRRPRAVSWRASTGRIGSPRFESRSSAGGADRGVARDRTACARANTGAATAAAAPSRPSRGPSGCGSPRFRASCWHARALSTSPSVGLGHPRREGPRAAAGGRASARTAPVAAGHRRRRKGPDPAARRRADLGPQGPKGQHLPQSRASALGSREGTAARSRPR